MTTALFLSCALALRPIHFRHEGTIIVKEWAEIRNYMMSRTPEYEFTLMLDTVKNENANYLWTPFVWNGFRIYARYIGASA